MTIDFETIANSPKSASNQNGSVTKHSIAEMIEADRYEKANNALSSPTSTKNPFTRGTFKAILPGCR